MAEKFPGLGDSKQRAFGLDMARFGEKGSRAAVVVAERARLSLHWSRADGTWGVTTRYHNALSQAPRRPDGTPALGWSGRVGVAVSGDDVVLVTSAASRGATPLISSSTRSRSIRGQASSAGGPRRCACRAPVWVSPASGSRCGPTSPAAA